MNATIQPTYTAEELQAMSIEQLKELYQQLGLRSNRMTNSMINKDWMVQDILRGDGIYEDPFPGASWQSGIYTPRTTEEPMNTTYTREDLLSRQYTRAKLEEIAMNQFGINADVVRLAPNKAAVVDMILLAQEEEPAIGTEPQVEPETAETVQTEIEYLEEVEESELPEEVETTEESELPEEIEPTEENPVEDSSPQPPTPTYEERLLLCLDRYSQLQDGEANWLLENFAQFKQSLTPAARPATRSANPRTPRATGPINPAQKLAIARECYEAVQTHGTAKAAGEALGKSAHYTKVLAKAYELHQQSQKIREAYDTGLLPWSQLYNLAFGFKKSDTISDVEAKMVA